MSIKPSSRSSLNFVPGSGDVTLSGAETLSNKTIQDSYITRPITRMQQEIDQSQNGYLDGTYNHYIQTVGNDVYFRNGLSYNSTINIRWSSTAFLSSNLYEGNSIVVRYLFNQLNEGNAWSITWQLDNSNVQQSVQWLNSDLNQESVVPYKYNLFTLEISYPYGSTVILAKRETFGR